MGLRKRARPRASVRTGLCRRREARAEPAPAGGDGPGARSSGAAGSSGRSRPAPAAVRRPAAWVGRISGPETDPHPARVAVEDNLRGPGARMTHSPRPRRHGAVPRRPRQTRALPNRSVSCACMSVQQLAGWRPEAESNRCTRICSPLHSHSAIRPVAWRDIGAGQDRGQAAVLRQYNPWPGSFDRTGCGSVIHAIDFMVT